MDHDVIIIIIASSAPIVAAIIAFFTIRYSKKSHERTAIMDVFHMFTDKHKDNEDFLIERFKDGSLSKIYKNLQVQSDVKKVWRVYDQIGLLVKKDLVPKEEFFQLIGLKMVGVYFYSKELIEERRVKRPFSLRFFTDVVIDCWDYYNKKGITIFNPATQNPIKKTELGKRVEFDD